MNKLFTLLMLFVLLFSAISTSATYSDELTDTEYTWELSIYDVAEPGNLTEGDKFSLIFNEAPAGNTVSDYNEGDVTFEHNGDSHDIPDNFEDWTDVDGIFFVIVLLWAVEDPADEWESDPNIEIVNGQAIMEDEDNKIAWNEESGLLEYFEFDDGIETVVIELYQEAEETPTTQDGLISLLSVSPLFVLFTLVAIPILRKFELRN